MGVIHSFFTITFATLGLSLSPIAATALNLSTVSSENELQDLLLQPAFVAEGRYNSIQLDTNAQAGSQVDGVWSNGEKQPFSLSYDGSTVKYTVGKTSLESQISGNYNDIFITTKTTEGCNSVVLNNLVLTDSFTSLSISGISASCGSNELSIFHFSDIKETFTLMGNALLSWMNPPQNPANLAYQIRVGNVEAPDTSTDTNQEPADPDDSTSTPPETSTGIDWFPSKEDGSYCTSP
ncbi:MAG TPA: choice-of-anchor W domain-containing protein [Waterburya sp.]|jgi:hypothetical protein